MQRVAAEQAARRPAHDFHGRGLLGVHLEQIVDVAESGRANRDAVLEQQESAASPGAGQHAGTDRRQVFLPGTTRNPHPRHAHEDLVRMVGAHKLHVFAVHRGQAAHGALAGGDGRLGAHDDFLQPFLAIGRWLRTETKGRCGCHSAQGATPQQRSCAAHPLAGTPIADQQGAGAAAIHSACSQNPRTASRGASATWNSSPNSIVARRSDS